MDENELSEEEKLILKILRTNGPTKRNGWWMRELSDRLRGSMTSSDVKGVVGKLLSKGLVQIMAHGDIRPCYKHHIVELVTNSEVALTPSDVATILRVNLEADEEVVREDVQELLDGRPFFSKGLRLNKEWKLELASTHTAP